MNSIIKNIFYLIILILICGCGSTIKDSVEPLSSTTKNYYSFWKPLKTSEIVTSKTCAPLFPENFSISEKLTLAEVIDITLVNNPDTKITWEEARRAASLYGESLSDYYPEINFDTTQTRERESTFATSPGIAPFIDIYRRTITTPEANLSYTIYDFGQRKYTSDSARYSLFYANRMQNQEIQTIMKSVMDDYYDYQYQKEALYATESDLENAQTALDAANVKFTAGLAAIGDIAQAKTTYLQTKLNLIDQTQSVETSYVTLLNNMGLPANIKINFVDFPEDILVKEMMESLQKLLNKSLKKRQDLLAKKDTAESNLSRVKLYQAKELPKIGGTFNFGRSYYDWKYHDDYHWVLQFRLSFPLFKGFFYKNQIKQAKADYNKAKAEIIQKELIVIKEVTNSHFLVNTSAKTVKYSTDYLQTAEVRFNIALANYKAGTNTILDVLAAQSSLADARAKNARAKKLWYTSLADLAYSTGSLCSGFEKKDCI